MNYKQRMLIELIELKKRIVKLENFMNTKVQTNTEEELLQKQLDGMNIYYDVLKDRLLIALEEPQKAVSAQ